MHSVAPADLTPPKASLRRGHGLLVNRPAGLPLSAEDIGPTNIANPTHVELNPIIAGRNATRCLWDGLIAGLSAFRPSSSRGPVSRGDESSLNPCARLSFNRAGFAGKKMMQLRDVQPTENATYFFSEKGDILQFFSVLDGLRRIGRGGTCQDKTQQDVRLPKTAWAPGVAHCS